MEPYRAHGTVGGSRVSRLVRLGALAALSIIVAATAALPAAASVSASCRIPDVFLNLPSDLKRTERLVDRARPVRIFVLGPSIGGTQLTERRRNRLFQELERRLPGVVFDIVDDGQAAGFAWDDFSRIRNEVARTEPDLVIWQVGTSEALAAVDPDRFGETLVQASDWLKGRGIDLILIDPPFLPKVQHEELYWRIVGKISEVSDKANLNLFRRYAAMQYLEQQRLPAPPPDARGRRVCMSELVAEAIVKAVTR
jgi:acyl-CoA thioesterase I